MQLDLFGLFKQKEKAPTHKELTRSQNSPRPRSGLDREVIRLTDKIQVEVTRRAFQRRWKLWVHPTGRVRVTCNKKVSAKAIKKWLVSMQPWIEKSLKSAEKMREKYPPKQYVDGEQFMFFGADYTLRMNPSAKAAVFKDSLEISLNVAPETSRALKQERLQMLYKKQARLLIPERVNYWSECMGLKPKAISLRGQKTRWGSCSSTGQISLNWKLIAAPLEVLDYVVIHELAHLQHPNHSQAFWGLVEAYCPEYKGLKKWLKENQYGFEFL